MPEKDIVKEIEKLRKEQVVIGELGYGSLAAGILAVIGVIYVIVRMKIASQTRQASQIRGWEENSRVL